MRFCRSSFSVCLQRLCHLWCLLNENNHRNPTLASTLPLRQPLSLTLYLDFSFLCILAMWWWKLHVPAVMIDWVMCFAGRHVYAQPLCVSGCWARVCVQVQLEKEKEKSCFWQTYWLTAWILWQSGQSHAESRTGQESPHLENKHAEQLEQHGLQIWESAHKNQQGKKKSLQTIKCMILWHPVFISAMTLWRKKINCERKKQRKMNPSHGAWALPAGFIGGTFLLHLVHPSLFFFLYCLITKC